MSIIVPEFILNEFKKENRQGDLEAWIMYMDLVGFTPLTASLLEDAGSGAEEVSALLNSIFSPLVDIVYSHGGFIPHFAGDAFYGIFPMTTTDIYVFTSAVKKIHAYSRTKNVKGNIPAWSVKIGLDAGRISWGIVGKEPYAYFFSGAVIRNSAICQQKARFRKEGIVFTRRIHDFLESIDLQGQLIEPDFYTWRAADFKKMKPKAGLFQAPRIGPFSQADHTPFLSPVFAETIPSGEFRSCISVFIGFTVSEDAAIFFDFLGQIVRHINEYGGYCKEFDFSEEHPWLIAFFGVPLASENQLERALTCVFRLFRDLRETFAPLGIRMKAAVTMGTGYTGFIGGKAMQQYSVVGNFVNLAARMIHQGLWGEIRTDKQVAQSEFFLFEYAGELTYKGIREEVDTFILRGQKPEGFQKFPYPLIGREQEKQELKIQLESLIANKKGQITIISGEPGVGKSRLAANLREEVIRNGRANWFFCPCDAVIKKPFNPFIHLLRHYFSQNIRGLSNRQNHYQRQFQQLIHKLENTTDTSGSHPARTVLIEKLRQADIAFRFFLGLDHPHSSWEDIAPQNRYQIAKNGIISLIQAESILHPLVVQVEDTHWLDPSSAELLGSLCPELNDYPLMILVTTRTEAAKELKTLLPFHASSIKTTFISLENFSKKHSAQFTNLILGGEAHETLLDYIDGTTNRNPFYLEQMVEFLKEKEWLSFFEGKWVLSTGGMVAPEKLGNLLTIRIDSLNRDLRELCKVAAVIGRAFDLSILEMVWEKLHGQNGTFSVQRSFIHMLIKSGIRENIWRPLTHHRFLFQHALLREAAYHIQLPATLQQIHLFVGEAIAHHFKDHIESKLQELAYHYDLANHSLKASEYLYRAAIQAKNNFLNNQALGFLEKLLKNPHEDAENPYTFKALILQGSILETTGYYERAEKIYQQTFLSLQDGYIGPFIPVLLNNLGRIQLFKGDYSAAMISQEKALTYAKKHGLPDLIPSTLAHLGNIYFRMGKYREANEYFIESLQLKVSGDKNFPSTQIRAKIALTQMNMGKNDLALETLHKQLSHCLDEKDKSGLATLYVYLGLVYLDKDEIASAKINFNEGWELANQTDNRHLQAIALGNMGIIFEREGDFHHAIIHYQKDLQICQELNDKQGISISLCLIGQLLSLKGEFPEAVNHLQKALTLSETLGFQKGMAKALNTLGDVYFLKKEHHRSIHFYERALTITERIHNQLNLGYTLIELGTVLLADRQYDKVHALLPKAASIANSLSNPALLFDLKLLEVKYSRARGEKIQAAEILVQMENMTCNREQEAERLFEWVQLFPEEWATREKAKEKYGALMEKTPKYIYRERLHLLNTC